MKKLFATLGSLVLLSACTLWNTDANIHSFADCVATYGTTPQNDQVCVTSKNAVFLGKNDAATKKDLIMVTAPEANTAVASPLAISGQARGTWFFEGSFPVELIDQNGATIGQGIASAEGEWMTEDFVPFAGTLTFTAQNSNAKWGLLVLRKDNPSGLPELDDELWVPVQL